MAIYNNIQFWYKKKKKTTHFLSHIFQEYMTNRLIGGR